MAWDTAKVIILHTLCDGYPMILKVSSAASVKHKAGVISDMMNIYDGDLAKKHTV
jgi:hypothetical protein